MFQLGTEDQDWYDRARHNVDPYGHLIHGNGAVLLLTAVTGQTLDAPASRVHDSGHLKLRAFNSAARRMRLVVAISSAGGCVAFSKRSAREFAVALPLPAYQREDRLHPRVDRSTAFEVVEAGSETLACACPQNSFVALSRFTAVVSTVAGSSGQGAPRPSTTSEPPSKETSMGAQEGRDYFGAVAKAAEGLPGGKLVLGPLNFLREEEKRKAANAKVAEQIAVGIQLSSEALLQIREVKELLGSEAFRADIVTAIIAASTKSVTLTTQSVSAASEPGISAFPLPIRKVTLKRELFVLFGQTESDIQYFRDKLRTHELEVGKSGSAAEAIAEFVDSHAGRSTRQLAECYVDLAVRKPASEMLKFVCSWLEKPSVA